MNKSRKSKRESCHRTTITIKLHKTHQRILKLMHNSLERSRNLTLLQTISSLLIKNFKEEN